MNQYMTERRLCWCYSILAVCMSISVICIAIPYNHWKTTLDVCPGGYFENTNCGCVLFGLSTTQYFDGGHNSYCLYAIFALLPLIVYAIVMAVFHMYRVCINNKGQYVDEKTTSVEEVEGEVIVVRSRAKLSKENDAIIYCWIPTSCIAGIFFLYNLVHAAITTDGFLRTCNQYKGHLVQKLPASGNHASVIHFRLTCQAVFDFMDYLLVNAPNSRRNETINTGSSLQIAIICSWISVVIWIIIVVFTARRAYNERDVLTCCGN
ncbi:hypothetical protein K1T71_003428 [Dendrolimus kikuchii]|uniref:Uncharacterized protein n=1 Tax=Dendrolimus kikuchii TaxID=765133 RepID=A0ACC1DBL2_9NEOP|nr:hypothetical protein K1T71_003428 [Dendrolimus kikuchii]